MSDHLQTVIGLSAVASAAIGAVIVGRSRNPTGWWLVAGGLALAVANVALSRAPAVGFFMVLGRVPGDLVARCAVSLPTARTVIVVGGSAAWAACLATAIVFFPFGALQPLRDRRIGGRRLFAAPALAWAGVAALVAAAATSADRLGPVSSGLLRYGCPLHATAPITTVGLVLLAAGGVTATVSALIRLRRVSGSDRGQLAPVAWTAAASIGVGVVAAIVQRTAAPDAGDARWLSIVWIVAGIGIPVAVAVSIVRHRTFGIFRLAGFMADYWIWTVGIAAVATAGAVGAAWAVAELTHLDRRPAAVAAIALAFGAAIMPLWRRQQRVVNARYGQHQEDPARTLEGLADPARVPDPAALRGPVFDLLERFAPIVIVDGSEGMRFALPTDDHEVGRHTFVHGAYDLATMRCAMTALGGGLDGGTVLDVGANIGTSIVPLLMRFGAAHGIAVEPEPRNNDLLRLNLDLNGLASRVDVLAMGLSDRDGTMELELSADNSGDHRLRVPGAELDLEEAARATVAVPVRRLDALVESGEVDLGALTLAWLDVQGHEGHVLAGGMSLMRSSVPIVTEFWPWAMDRNGGLTRFIELVTQHVERVVDLRATQAEGHAVQAPASEIGAWASRYAGASAFTDLLLLR